jgi:isopenicillin-N epimerase
MNSLKKYFMLDPEVVFLNHGSFGATPKPVFREYQRWQRELERQPVEFLGRRFANLMADSRLALGKYLGNVLIICLHPECNHLSQRCLRVP